MVPGDHLQVGESRVCEGLFPELQSHSRLLGAEIKKKTDHPISCEGVKWCSHFRKQPGGPSKKLNHMTQQFRS